MDSSIGFLGVFSSLVDYLVESGYGLHLLYGLLILCIVYRDVLSGIIRARLGRRQDVVDKLEVMSISDEIKKDS